MATFDQQVIPILPTKLCINWPFGQEEEVQIEFQGGGRGGHIGFLSGKILAFLSTRRPDTSYQVSRLMAEECRRICPLKQIVNATRRTTDIDRSQ